MRQACGMTRRRRRCCAGPPACRQAGGGARGVAGRRDERCAAAGPDSDVGLSGAAGVPAAGGDAPRRWPATAHVQPRVTQDNLILHMQHEVGHSESSCGSGAVTNSKLAEQTFQPARFLRLFQRRCDSFFRRGDSDFHLFAFLQLGGGISQKPRLNPKKL